MNSHTTYSGPLKAVILDWAGTTVDYGCFAPVAVFIEVFRQRGIEISIAQARAPMGLEKRDHIRAIARMPEVAAHWRTVQGTDCSEADINIMYRQSITVQTHAVLQYANLIPGACEAIKCCREMGLKIGSTTGYSQSILNALMPVAAQQGYIPDAAVCPSVVPVGRPAPWMIYQNAIHLDVFPLAAFVKIGDTVPEIEEGLNAGTWTVGVTQSGNELGLSEADASALSRDVLQARLRLIEERLLNAGAHYVIRSIADLPPVLAEINTRLMSGEQP